MPDAQEELPPFQTYIEAGKKRGILWTPLRRRVLDLLWRDRKPWGAYGVAQRLLKGRGPTHPNSIYRTLRTLEEATLVAPIRQLRRYVISPDPECAEWSALICSDCGSLSLLPMPPEAEDIRALAARHGFRARSLVVECTGRCRRCANETGKQTHETPVEGEQILERDTRLHPLTHRWEVNHG